MCKFTQVLKIVITQIKITKKKSLGFFMFKIKINFTYKQLLITNLSNFRYFPQRLMIFFSIENFQISE